MQVAHAADSTEINSVRGKEREFKTLLIGEDGALDNFRLYFVRQKGEVDIPRHKHNFDQIRMCLSGEGQNYGPDRWIRPGEVVYFPEGVPYGPEDSDCQRLGVTLQFGGASGSGFVSSRRTKQGMEELKAYGAFEKGIFTRHGDIAPGERRNQDSFEAVWEHVTRRKLEYPKPRYDEPIMMRSQNFAWQDAGQAGLSIKPLGSFTERHIEVALLKLAAGARARTATRPGRQVAFVTQGIGHANGSELRLHSALLIDPRESVEIDSQPGLELLLVGLPIFAEQRNATSNAA